jgi:hypothetical protein
MAFSPLRRLDALTDQVSQLRAEVAAALKTRPKRTGPPIADRFGREMVSVPAVELRAVLDELDRIGEYGAVKAVTVLRTYVARHPAGPSAV